MRRGAQAVERGASDIPRVAPDTWHLAPGPSLLWINHFAVAPADGGGTRHFELARALGARGWRTTVAASDFHLHSRSYTRRSSPAAREPVREHLDGVDFLWLWAAPYTANDWRRGWNWLSFSRGVTRFRPESRPDLVIGSSPHLFAALAGARIATRLDVPFVLEVRDLWPESLIAAGGKIGATYHALAAIARYLYRRATRIITLSRGTGEYLVRLGVDPERLIFVPNGANTAGFVARSREARSTFTAIYAGAHGPANGLDTVLAAAELLQSEAPDVRIVLVGDGPAKRDLIARAQQRALSNVVFRDPVSKPELAGLLARADAGLMVLRDAPLFAYGVSPNKLFDYFAAALPVACNVPGEVASMLRDANGGEQATDSSPRALADAILRLARRPIAERERLGTAAQQWVRREHDRTTLAARLDDALRPLVFR